jgi:hypothetical protein
MVDLGWIAPAEQKLYTQIVRVLGQRLLTDVNMRQRLPVDSQFLQAHLRILDQDIQAWFQSGHWKWRIFTRGQDSTPLDREILLSHLGGLEQRTLSREWQLILNAPLNWYFNDQTLFLRNDLIELQYDFNSVGNLNLIRLVVRALLRAYGNRYQDVHLSHLTEAQLTQVWSDLQPILNQLRLLDEQRGDFIKSRFLEANLFTPHANGNSELDFREAVGLISILWSGFRVYQKHQDRLDRFCRRELVFERGRQFVSKNCVAEFVWSNRHTLFWSLPAMGAFVESLSPDRRQQFFDNLLKAARLTTNEQGLLLVSDFLLIPPLLKYIEALMIRFDLDRNQIVDKAEAMNLAYPIFRELLARVNSSLNSERRLRGAFSYFLVYGKGPETSSEQLWFLTRWIFQEDSWPVSADRFRLTEVLAYIGEQIGRNRILE